MVALIAMFCLSALATSTDAQTGGGDYLILRHNDSGSFSFVNLKDRTYSWGSPNCDLAGNAQDELNGKAVTWNDIIGEGSNTRTKIIPDLTCQQMKNLLSTTSNPGATGGSGGSDGTSVSLGFKTLGVNDGYVKVIINPIPSGTKVNVFRNGVYVATLQNDDLVVNDDKGENGHIYRLVAERDGVEVARIEREVLATNGEGSAASFLVIPGGMELYWGPQSGYTYSIYRKDSGGTVGYNQGTRLATGLPGSLSGPAFVDPNPKRGASYGIVGETSAGGLTPVLTVEPDYDNPQVNAAPQAFENGFFIFGEGLQLSPPANRCDYDETVSEVRYCEVSSPGQYTVTHLVSQKSWTVDVKGPSPETHRFMIVNGVRVAVADTNYGSVLVMKSDAEFEAVTGLKALESGATARSGAVASDPPTKKYFHYTAPMEIGRSPADVSANIGLVDVYQFNDDGSVGRLVGHWDSGKYYNPEQHRELIKERVRKGAYLTAKVGMGAIEASPWGQARKWTTKAAWNLINWVLDNYLGPDRIPPDTDGDGESDSWFCSGGSNCHSGIVLNEQTDPDGDGLSVFGDDDNDGDQVDDWEDDDPTDPNCHTDCNPGGDPDSAGTDGDTGDDVDETTAGETGDTKGTSTSETGNTGQTADTESATGH